jgi:hypothetical protein
MAHNKQDLSKTANQRTDSKHSKFAKNNVFTRVRSKKKPFPNVVSVATLAMKKPNVVSR